MAAVLLACLSAVLFGAMTVALRFALRQNSDAEAGSLVTVGGALVVCLLGATTDPGNLSPSRLWPFFRMRGSQYMTTQESSSKGRIGISHFRYLFSSLPG